MARRRLGILPEGGGSLSKPIGHFGVVAPLVLLALANGCAIDGKPVATAPYVGEVHVEIALSDSFDVLPDGKCRGRLINEAFVDGAPITIRRKDAGSKVPHVSAVVSTRYEDDVDRRRGPYDDGRYCVAAFSFTTPEPSFTGYSISFDEETRMGSRGFDLYPPVGEYATSVFYTCEDYDAPPEEFCGFG